MVESHRSGEEFIWWEQNLNQSRLAGISRRHNFITIRDTSTMQTIYTLRPASRRPYKVVWSPDDTKLLSIHGDNIQLWDMTSGHQIAKNMQYRSRSGDFLGRSPNGHYFATFNIDNYRRFTYMSWNIRIWDAESGLPIWETPSYRINVDNYLGVEFSWQDSTFIVTDQYALRQWDTTTQTLINENRIE